MEATFGGDGTTAVCESVQAVDGVFAVLKCVSAADRITKIPFVACGEAVDAAAFEWVCCCR